MAPDLTIVPIIMGRLSRRTSHRRNTENLRARLSVPLTVRRQGDPHEKISPA